MNADRADPRRELRPTPGAAQREVWPPQAWGPPMSAREQAAQAAYLKFAGPDLDEVDDRRRGRRAALGPDHQRALGGKFERQLEAFCGGRPVRVLTSATAAIEVALQLCGIGPGDEVITGAQSFFTVLNMIVKVGATPVFVDCELVTRNIDLAQVEAAITPRTKAIIPTHFPGALVDLDALYALARRRGLRVIEDAALVLGSRWRGTECRRDRRYRHLQLSSEQERDIDRRRRAGRQRPGRSAARRGAALPRHQPPARPHARRRVSGRQVQPARRQRPHRLMRRSSACRSFWPSAARWSTVISPGLRPTRRACCRRGRRPPTTVIPGTCSASCCRSQRMTIDRNGFRNAMEARGDRDRRIVRSLHLCTLGRRFGGREGQFPNAERIARETVTLPLHTRLAEADVDRVCEAAAAIIAAAGR